MRLKLWIATILSLAPPALMAWPAQQIRLSATPTNGGAYLSWIVPMPPGATTLTSLDVRQGTSPINTLNWSGQTQLVLLTNSIGVSGTIQTVSVPDLAPNQTYYFAIKYLASDGSSSTISTMGMVKAGGSTFSVTLAWDVSTDPNVAGYRLYYGVGFRTYTNMVDVGDVASGTVTGLEYGITYHISVTDYDSTGGESDYSIEALYPPP